MGDLGRKARDREREIDREHESEEVCDRRRSGIGVVVTGILFLGEGI